MDRIFADPELVVVDCPICGRYNAIGNPSMVSDYEDEIEEEMRHPTEYDEYGAIVCKHFMTTMRQDLAL